jgi:cell division protein FtsB
MVVPWTAVLVYAFFSFVLGQDGLYARKHLEAEHLRLVENQKTLEQTKSDFLKIKDNLTSDRDTLSVYARQLGYGTEDEKFIRIKGLSVAVNTNMPAGRVLYAAGADFIADSVIKMIAAFFALTILVFFLVKDLILSRYS